MEVTTSHSERCNSRRPPILLRFRSARWFIIFTVSTAVFTEIFLYGIVVPVLPFSLVSRVGIPEHETQQWVSVLLAVYAAFLVAFAPLCGWIADRTRTRRLPLLASLLTFAAATLLLMLGRSIGALVAGRALQGISGAAVWSIGLALLVDTIGPEDVGEAMGYVSLSMALAIFCAPLLGGVVYQRAGYYAVFYMAFGVIALDVVLRFLVIEQQEAREWLQPSVLDDDDDERMTGGSIALSQSRPDTSATTADEQQAAPASSAQADAQSPAEEAFTLPSGVLADSGKSSDARKEDAADLAAAIPVAGKPPARFWSKHRLPPVITLLASGRLLTALWGCLVLSTIMTSFDTVLPLRVKEIFHWDSLGAGLVFVAVVTPMLLNPLMGKIADRYGSRVLTTSGLILNVPLLVCLRFVNHDSLQQKALLCALLTLLGLAISSSLVPLLAEITYTIEQKQKQNPGAFGKKGAFAQGYGLMNAAYSTGTLIGPLWSGFVNQHAGWNTMAWSLALFSGLSAIPIFLFLGGWIGQKSWRAVVTRTGAAEKQQFASSDYGKV